MPVAVREAARGPEKYLYVFCVDADGKDNDFFTVVDVTPTARLSARSTTRWTWERRGTRRTTSATPMIGQDLGRGVILEPDLDHRRGHGPGQAAHREGHRKHRRNPGLSGPHSYYALPGRMLITFLGSSVGGLPAGMAEFTNDGKFIRLIEHPSEAPYGYDVAVKPRLNRMVTSSFTPLRNYKKPLAQMDLKDFGSELIVWDFKNRQPLQVGKAGLAPLEVRWSLKPENNYGFTNCALDNSIWLFRGNGEGNYSFKKVADTGAMPADLRQSPDDKYLYVSCFGDNVIQQWDVSDPDHPKLASTVSPCVQPNMMHVTGDGKRMYVSNSLLSTLDHAGRFYIRLVHVGPDGMKVDPFFNIDLNKLPTGPARGMTC